MTDVAAIRRDLAAEHDALDAVVAPLDEAGWATPTPAEGWTVRDQIGHLTYFDGTAVLALTDQAAFAEVARVLAGSADDADAVALAEARTTSGADVLAAWRDGRRRLLAAVDAADPSARVPWYGPSMSLASFVTARLMETWAHGRDVADAVGADLPATDRLRHVAELGVRTRGWSYRVRGLPVPDGDVRVELTVPSGGVWAWGDESAADRLSGPALDFCLVVTQRRHPADTALVAEGPRAEEWLAVAQVYAGPPGPGRPPAGAGAQR